MINSFIKQNIFRPLFSHLTAGETINSLKSKIDIFHQQNIFPIVDYIKEGSNSHQNINNCILNYIKIGNISKIDYIGIKLSSFGFLEDKIDYLVDTLVNTSQKKIMIDAEDIKNQDKINKITYKLLEKYNKNEINIYKTYQMYRKDSLCMLKYDINNINNLGVKLVRGAYYNQDYKSGLLFTDIKYTDNTYNRAMDILFHSKNTHSFICTHNYYSINKLLNYIKNNNNNNLAHASLYGFINNETKQIIKSGIPTYKYLPYGNFDDSVPYLTRRIYENPKILYYLI
jgi:proline dehydrogenase